MKTLFLLLCVLALPLLASAQIRFGYFSYDTVLKSMPDYLMAQRNIDDLRQKYDNEMKRSEQEFNAKYEEFLDAQRDLVPSILRKRQTEIQEMMEKKAQAQRGWSQGGSTTGLRIYTEHRRRRMPVRQP